MFTRPSADVVCLGNESVRGAPQRNGEVMEAAYIEWPVTEDRVTRRRYPGTVGAPQAAGRNTPHGLVRDISCEHDRARANAA